MGTSLVASTSNLVEHGGVVMQLTMQVSFSELANTGDFVQRQNCIVMSQYHACFVYLSIAVLDPIDRVQQRSLTTCVGRLAKFNEVVTIHAVWAAVQNVPASGVEESSAQWLGDEMFLLCRFLFNPFFCLRFWWKSLLALVSGWWWRKLPCWTHYCILFSVSVPTWGLSSKAPHWGPPRPTLSESLHGLILRQTFAVGALASGHLPSASSGPPPTLNWVLLPQSLQCGFETGDLGLHLILLPCPSPWRREATELKEDVNHGSPRTILSVLRWNSILCGHTIPPEIQAVVFLILRGLISVCSYSFWRRSYYFWSSWTVTVFDPGGINFLIYI